MTVVVEAGQLAATQAAPSQVCMTTMRARR